MAGPRRGKSGEGVRKGARILIVEARYYDDIADALLAGATKALEEAGAEIDRIGTDRDYAKHTPYCEFNGVH